MNAFVLYSQSFAVIVLSCLLNFAIIFEMLIFENTRFRGVLDITAHYFYNDQRLCIVLKNPLQYVHRPLLENKNMKVQVVNRNI